MIQTVLLQSLAIEKSGVEVTMNLKIGRLTLAQGSVSFASEKFQAINNIPDNFNTINAR